MGTNMFPRGTWHGDAADSLLRLLIHLFSGGEGEGGCDEAFVLKQTNNI